MNWNCSWWVQYIDRTGAEIRQINQKLTKAKCFFSWRRNICPGLPSKDDTDDCTELLLSIVLCDCKLESISCKSLNKPLRDYCQGTIINLTLKSSYFKSAKSSLQSQPLWLTMYFEFGFSWQFNLNFLIMIYFICVYLRKKT